MTRILYRSLIGHEDLDLGFGKVTQERGPNIVDMQRIQAIFIFETVDVIKALVYTKYPHVGLHQIGAVIEYYFDPSSMAIPDNDFVLLPNSIHISKPGRYIKVLGGGGGGGGMNYTYVDSDYTISYANEVVLVDSNVGPITITFPVVPVKDNYVGVWDCGDRASVNNITILRNGNTIHNLSEDALIDIKNGRFDFIYTGSTWELSPIVGCSSVYDTIICSASDQVTPLTVDLVNPHNTFRAPYPLDLTHGYVRINVNTAPTGAPIIVDLHMNGVSMFSTLLQIDIGTKTSLVSLVPAVLTTTSVPDDAEFEIFVTQKGSIIAGTGLKTAVTGIKVP